MAVNFYKDPDSVLDYMIDWSIWLVDDIITSSAWEATGGITIDLESYEDTTTTIWVSGGTIGRLYSFTNRIVTSGGRTTDRTFSIKCQNRC